jgi:hypothetical protein
MQHIFIRATKQHLFSASLSRCSQPNMTGSHTLSLSHVSLAPRYEPGSTSTRTKQARKGGKGREGISLSAIYALVVSSLEREDLSAASNTAACGASFSKMKSSANSCADASLFFNGGKTEKTCTTARQRRNQHWLWFFN